MPVIYVATGMNGVDGNIYQVSPVDASILSTTPLLDQGTGTLAVGLSGMAIDSFGYLYGLTDPASPNFPETVLWFPNASVYDGIYSEYPGTIGIAADWSDICFDAQDYLYLYVDSGHMYHLDIANNGDAILASASTPGPTNVSPNYFGGIDYDPNNDIFYIAGTAPFGVDPDGSSWLFTADYQPRDPSPILSGDATAVGTAIGDTGIPIAPDFNLIRSLKLDTDLNVLWAVTCQDFPTFGLGCQLWTIDPATGIATLIGALPDNTSALAVVPSIDHLVLQTVGPPTVGWNNLPLSLNDFYDTSLDSFTTLVTVLELTLDGLPPLGPGMSLDSFTITINVGDLTIPGPGGGIVVIPNQLNPLLNRRRKRIFRRTGF